MGLSCVDSARVFIAAVPGADVRELHGGALVPRRQHVALPAHPRLRLLRTR